MKKILSFALLLALFGISHAFAQESKVDLSTPEATFKTLLKAIKSKNLEVYQQCWDPERVEREGSLSKLRDFPKEWEELQGLFKGPQKLQKSEITGSGDNQRYKTRVKAPKAEGGGIGTLSMIKIGEEWKMYSW